MRIVCLVQFSLASLALLSAGCQQYRPQPLDLEAHRQAFLERSPASPEVTAFAQSLAAPGEAAPAGFDLTDGVSPAEAELVALVFNADLRLARLQAGITQAGAANAGLWEDPRLGIDVSRIIESTPDPWKLTTMVSFTIPISGRLEIEKKLAGADHAADLARIAAMEWQVRTDLRERFIEWSALRTQVQATREFIAAVAQLVDIVDRIQQAGELSRAEARLFTIELASRRAELAQVESRLDQAALAIKRLMGIAPSAPAEFVPWTLDSAATAESESDFERLADGNPDLLVARAGYEIAERTLELEVRRQYPDLELAPGYELEDGKDKVLLGISLPIPVLNANRKAIAEAFAARELARGVFETASERLIADLAQARIARDAAARQRAILADSIAPLVDAQYAEARKIAELGEVNTLVLLETLTRQQETRVQLIDAAQSQMLGEIRIQRILGPQPTQPRSDMP